MAGFMVSVRHVCGRDLRASWTALATLGAKALLWIVLVKVVHLCQELLALITCRFAGSMSAPACVLQLHSDRLTAGEAVVTSAVLPMFQMAKPARLCVLATSARREVYARCALTSLLSRG